jgi:hypothetical protein
VQSIWVVWSSAATGEFMVRGAMTGLCLVKNRREGAQSLAGTLLEPKLREKVSLGVRQGWARGEGRKDSDLVLSVFCVSVLCRYWPGAGSYLVRTGNSSDRADTERVKSKI